MELEEKLNVVREELTGNRWNKTAMAEALGVSRFTLINIANGKTKNPGIVTVQKIETYMQQMRDKQNDSARFKPTKQNPESEDLRQVAKS